MPPKSVKSSVSSTGNKEKFPVSKVDYTQPLIVKNSKVTFNEKLEQAKEEHKETLDDLIYEMEAMKRENERLRRQQEDTYGVSLDTVERMKKELERARTTRMFLLEDIEVRKAKSEKMEAEIFELNMKLESFTKKINELSRMRTEWQETAERLQKSEDKCEKLAKVNKNMRVLLVKHHIDPKTVEFDSGRSKKSKRSEKGPLKPILKPDDLKKKPDAHTQSHVNASNSSHKTSRSLTDLREAAIPVNGDLKRRTALTSRKALGRGPPSYMGYYADIHQHRQVLSRNKHDPVHLPRVAVI